MSAHESESWEAVGRTVRTTMTSEDREGIEVATVALWHGGEIASRRARLIAAAPDLLAALKGILAVASVRIDDPRIEKWIAADKAIAKAEGES